MSDGREIIALVAQRQDCEQFRRKNWVGTFAEYLDIVREHPEVTRTAYQRLYDMILSYGVEVTDTGREKHVHYRFFDDPDNDGRDAVFGLDGPLHHLVNALEERRGRLRHRTPRAAAARPGRQQQEHDRPPAQEGPRALFGHRRRRLYTLGWVDDNDPQNAEAIHWCPMNEEPLHLIPERFRPDVEAQAQRRAAARTIRASRSSGELGPFCRFMYHQRLKKYDGDWTRVVQDVRVKRVDPQREGPRRHRHVPAQGRKEPGRHRADRRHQLPQDRRVRQRQRSAGVQLRRRIQHRQPRHHRVRRSAQARRGVPVRPARRQPGTQDQAEEVRPDRHRRSDRRPHERAGVSPAAEQRVHGSAPRPDGEDRRAVRHDAGRTRSRFTRRTTTSKTVRGKHIAPHTIEMAAMWAVLTRLEEPKNAGLTRLQKLKLYNGKTLPGFTEENIKELREQATQRRHDRHLAALRAGQDLQRPGGPSRGQEHQPVHGAQRAGSGPQAPQPDHAAKRPSRSTASCSAW